MRKLLSILLLFILLCVGLAHAEEKRYSVPIDDSPSLGPADAQITVIEFLDFQ